MVVVIDGNDDDDACDDDTNDGNAPVDDRVNPRIKGIGILGTGRTLPVRGSGYT